MMGVAAFIFDARNRRLLIAAAVLAVLGVVGWQIDSRAYNRGFAASDLIWTARVEAETARQVEANEQAFQEALAQIEQLKEAKEVRDATIERLNAEALLADDADELGLSADSVRRLTTPD